MLVRQVMNKNVIIAKPDITVREASEVMSRFHVGSVVIVDDGKITGILTERNILIAVAQGKDPETTTAADIMTKSVVTTDPDKDIRDAIDLMIKHKIKKLPVIQEGKLVGIITASDIIVFEPKLIEGIASLISVRLPKYHAG